MFRVVRPVGVALLALSVGGTALGQTTQAAQKQILLKAGSAWNGSSLMHYPTSLPQLTVLRLTIPAHAALPWHTHPFQEVGYVASGAITLEDGKTGKRHTFRAGEAFTETVNAVHRGVTGAQPTVLIVTYVGTPGVPTSIPARGARADY